MAFLFGILPSVIFESNIADSARQSPPVVNVAARLTEMARTRPDAVAVVEPLGYDAAGHRRYRHVTFRELDEDSDRIARGMLDAGAARGMRLALLVRPGIDFISLVFAMLKAGVVTILIDPGMGGRKLIHCLAEAEPEGFVAIPPAHAVRVFLRNRFPLARFNVTVGRRWFWSGPTLEHFRRRPHPGSQLAPTMADDPAAIIFTTGSTGPPKGVLYRHGNFDHQVTEIRDFYGIELGEIDVPGFPLFGLFNCAMGVTAVIPDMDPSRPARVDPARYIEAIEDWKATQSFASPAVWNRVGRYCEKNRIRLETLRRVLSAGAPIPVHVLQRMKACIHEEGEVHTPYGATEALPVASISAGEVLQKTAKKTDEGAGVCVGGRFPGIAWKVIRILDGPIRSIDQTEELPTGEIGELIVRGPVVTREYVDRPEANVRSKIRDGDAFWHRMGDVGYLDDRERFWFCGRLAHRLLTPEGPMYTILCEAIFNRHPAVYRSALVGLGRSGEQRPVIIVELHKDRMPRNPEARAHLREELEQLGQSSPLTSGIRDFRLHPNLPVDIRHNAKIFREKLARWVEQEGESF